MTEATVGEVRAALENAKVPFKRIDPLEGGKLLVRFATSGDQLHGEEAIETTLSEPLPQRTDPVRRTCPAGCAPLGSSR